MIGSINSVCYRKSRGDMRAGVETLRTPSNPYESRALREPSVLLRNSAFRGFPRAPECWGQMAGEEGVDLVGAVNGATNRQPLKSGCGGVPLPSRAPPGAGEA